MLAGMVPMALAFGEGGEQTAPLGRAVIGGLVAATLATLLVLPAVFAAVQGRSGTASPSLDPGDPDSPHYHADALASEHGVATGGHVHRKSGTINPMNIHPHSPGGFAMMASWKNVLRVAALGSLPLLLAAAVGCG